MYISEILSDEEDNIGNHIRGKLAKFDDEAKDELTKFKVFKVFKQANFDPTNMSHDEKYELLAAIEEVMYDYNIID